MCGSSKTPAPIKVPPPPPLQPPVKVASKEDVAGTQGSVDPVSGKYVMKRQGLSAFRLNQK